MTELFQEASNRQAFLKCGVLGFAGAGKTFTTAQIAVGLHKHIKSDKPVFFVDTETGADYVLPLFQEAGIKLMTAKTRAFSKLLELVDHAEKEGSILIIDSISHFWTELLEAFMAKKKINRLLFQHWQPIKQEWRVYTDKFINSKLHIIMCGRAGWEYDFRQDDEGVNELIKTGTKMKAETEMGFEPSLIIEMEHIKSETGRIGSGLIHRGWIIKDRTNRIQGKFFDNPGFDNILPHIQALNIGGDHIGVNPDDDSQALFDNNNSGSNLHKRREIALEEIENEMVMGFPGQDKESKQAKIQILRDVFQTGSWTALKDMHAELLEDGLLTIKKIVAEKQKGVKKDDGKN